jgi:hypothetical protein
MDSTWLPDDPNGQFVTGRYLPPLPPADARIPPSMPRGAQANGRRQYSQQRRRYGATLVSRIR